jgi:hypothetical protein
VLVVIADILIVYLASMAVIGNTFAHLSPANTNRLYIAGAKNFEQVKATVKVGFLPVMKISWMVSPVTLVLTFGCRMYSDFSSYLRRNISLLKHGVDLLYTNLTLISSVLQFGELCFRNLHQYPDKTPTTLSSFEEAGISLLISPASHIQAEDEKKL